MVWFLFGRNGVWNETNTSMLWGGGGRRGKYRGHIRAYEQSTVGVACDGGRKINVLRASAISLRSATADSRLAQRILDHRLVLWHRFLLHGPIYLCWLQITTRRPRLVYREPGSPYFWDFVKISSFSELDFYYQTIPIKKRESNGLVNMRIF